MLPDVSLGLGHHIQSDLAVEALIITTAISCSCSNHCAEGALDAQGIR